MAGGMLPAIAVQTCHAPGEGVHEPAVWAPLLRELQRTPGGEVIAARTVLADRTLAGLPAARAAWGAERVAVGTLVALQHPGATDKEVLFLAPEAAGYRALCRFLSWSAEQPTALQRWLGEGLAASDPRLGPSLAGVVCLVRDRELARLLLAVGAEVMWWCRDHPDDESARAWGLPAVWIPLVSLCHTSERATQPIRVGIARRSRQHPHASQHPYAPHPFTAPSAGGGGLALDELARLSARFESRPELLIAGHVLLARCTYVPGPTLHMPPSRYADAAAELARRAQHGAEQRYGIPLPEAVVARLTHELAIIADKDFSGYILTVADLALGRRTCGRGSAASSLVVYALGITNVDPLRYNLLFERFLSHVRVDPPDIDVDFPWDERDAVFAAALAVYGPAHVAMVATHLRLRGKGALRAVARAWGVSESETTAVASRLRAERRYGTPAQLAEPWPALLADAAAVEGLHMHDGLHCGGLIITPEPIRDLVPVHPASKLIDTATRRWEESTFEPVPAIAWEKDGAEAMGLVKIDLLGNRSLAVIRDCLQDLAAEGRGIDELTWRPAEDAATQALVASGATIGCFYIESPAMRNLQAKAASGDLDRLVVHSSIIRPAANHWIDEYLHRLHHHRRTGRYEDHWFPHPALRDLLSESFGILSYQEDVMLVAKRVAGFDERQANALRKAIGDWGKADRLQVLGETFRRGGLAQGATLQAVDAVWEMIASFAGYSFAKAHSASYAMVSFQCAWLKAHAPASFLARVIANEGGFYSASAYVEEARRLGVEIRGPSVVHSVWRTAPDGDRAIRLGLHLIPLVTKTTAALIAREQQRVPFCGLSDLARRCRLAPRTLLSLARVGALDDIRPELPRGHILWLAQVVGLEGLHRGARGRTEPGSADPGSADPGIQWLFTPAAWSDPLVPALALPDHARERWERYNALGICPEHHPLQFTTRPDVTRAMDILQAEAHAWVSLSGLVVTRKQVTATSAKHGRSAMAFVTLEDETGLIETVWFSQAYKTAGAVLDRGTPVRIHGRIQRDFGVVTVHVDYAEAVAWRA